MRMEKYKAKRAAKAAKKAKAPLSPVSIQVVPTSAESTTETKEQELEHYFSTAAMLEVVTYLLIPLAPTPTSRLPLPLNPPATSAARPLLPMSAIASLHASHGTHALRVSTIFARLDAARVFDDPSVQCAAHGDPSGLCTVLEVRFEGWTVNKVRGVLGEAGSGWCVLEEVWPAHEDSAQSEDDMDAGPGVADMECATAVRADAEGGGREDEEASARRCFGGGGTLAMLNLRTDQ